MLYVKESIAIPLTMSREHFYIVEEAVADGDTGTDAPLVAVAISLVTILTTELFIRELMMEPFIRELMTEPFKDSGALELSPAG